MKGMVLAAGFGVRFRPVTSRLPKPLIPLCLRPLAEWAIDSLVDSGVDQIVMNLHHLPDLLERFIVQRYRGKVPIVFSREEEILGTGGGLAKVRSFFDGEESFFLVNGDTIQASPPLRELEEARSGMHAIAALLLRPRDPSAPHTGVAFDGERVEAFRADRDDPWMFAGAHALSPEIFRWIPPAGPSGIVTHAYEPMLSGSDETIAGIVWDGVWHDIGTPGRYFAATVDVLRLIASGEVSTPERGSIHGTSLVHDGANILGETLGSVVGEASFVARGSRVERSVLWEGCRVGEESEVSDSILTDGVVLSPGSRIGNAMICVFEGTEVPIGGRLLDGHLVAVPIESSREMTIART